MPDDRDSIIINNSSPMLAKPMAQVVEEQVELLQAQMVALEARVQQLESIVSC